MATSATALITKSTTGGTLAPSTASPLDEILAKPDEITPAKIDAVTTFLENGPNNPGISEKFSKLFATISQDDLKKKCFASLLNACVQFYRKTSAAEFKLLPLKEAHYQLQKLLLNTPELSSVFLDDPLQRACYDLNLEEVKRLLSTSDMLDSHRDLFSPLQIILMMRDVENGKRQDFVIGRKIAIATELINAGADLRLGTVDQITDETPMPRVIKSQDGVSYHPYFEIARLDCRDLLELYQSKGGTVLGIDQIPPVLLSGTVRFEIAPGVYSHVHTPLNRVNAQTAGVSRLWRYLTESREVYEANLNSLKTVFGEAYVEKNLAARTTDTYSRVLPAVHPDRIELLALKSQYRTFLEPILQKVRQHHGSLKPVTDSEVFSGAIEELRAIKAAYDEIRRKEDFVTLFDVAFSDRQIYGPADNLERKVQEIETWVTNQAPNNEALKGVKTLSLEGKTLEHLPEKIATYFPYLQTINLSGNFLKSIPAKWPNTLKSCNVSHNLIAEFPEEFTAPELEYLYFAHNCLETYPERLATLRLKELHFSHNRLRALPLHLQYMNRITRIQEDGTEVVVEEGSQPLTILDLSHNEISTLPPRGFVWPRSITSLLLGNNRFDSSVLTTQFPENCTDVFLHGNQITEIPEQHGLPTKLKWIRLDGNPINPMPTIIPSRSEVTIVTEAPAGAHGT